MQSYAFLGTEKALEEIKSQTLTNPSILLPAVLPFLNEKELIFKSDGLPVKERLDLLTQLNFSPELQTDKWDYFPLLHKAYAESPEATDLWIDLTPFSEAEKEHFKERLHDPESSYFDW